MVDIHAIHLLLVAWKHVFAFPKAVVLAVVLDVVLWWRKVREGWWGRKRHSIIGHGHNH
jgi:hypothetical protein